MFVYVGDPGLIDYSNDGDSNFFVNGLVGGDLFINEIGPVSGTTTITVGPILVVVDAEGGLDLGRFGRSDSDSPR